MAFQISLFAWWCSSLVEDTVKGIQLFIIILRMACTRSVCHEGDNERPQAMNLMWNNSLTCSERISFEYGLIGVACLRFEWNHFSTALLFNQFVQEILATKIACVCMNKDKRTGTNLMSPLRLFQVSWSIRNLYKNPKRNQVKKF